MDDFTLDLQAGQLVPDWACAPRPEGWPSRDGAYDWICDDPENATILGRLTKLLDADWAMITAILPLRVRARAQPATYWTVTLSWTVAWPEGPDSYPARMDLIGSPQNTRRVPPGTTAEHYNTLTGLYDLYLAVPGWTSYWIGVLDVAWDPSDPARCHYHYGWHPALAIWTQTVLDAYLAAHAWGPGPADEQLWTLCQPETLAATLRDAEVRR